MKNICWNFSPYTFLLLDRYDGALNVGKGLFLCFKITAKRGRIEWLLSVCAMNQRTAPLLCRLRNVFRLQERCMNECTTSKGIFLIIALFAILSLRNERESEGESEWGVMRWAFPIRQINVFELHEKQSNFIYLGNFYLCVSLYANKLSCACESDPRVWLDGILCEISIAFILIRSFMDFLWVLIRRLLRYFPLLEF